MSYNLVENNIGNKQATKAKCNVIDSTSKLVKTSKIIMLCLNWENIFLLVLKQLRDSLVKTMRFCL